MRTFSPKPSDITREELVAMRKQIQERTIGAFQGPIHAPDHWWQDNLYLERGGQISVPEFASWLTYL